MNEPLWLSLSPKTCRRLGICLLLVALAANEVLIARLLSSDGVLDPSIARSIRWMQVVFIAAGIGLLLRRPMLMVGLIAALSIPNFLVYRKHVKIAIAAPPVTEGRFHELRRMLPAMGSVGYVSDEMPWTTNTSTERYYFTQYAMVPIVVELGPKQEWVIGNFKNFDPELAPRNMAVVRNFGGGLILFKRSN